MLLTVKACGEGNEPTPHQTTNIRGIYDIRPIRDGTRKPMNQKQRILIVDDDKNMSKTVQDILNSHGYRTRVANTGEDALALAKENHFDCVLSDIKMPGMSGVDLFHAFQVYHPDIPIILMTAYASTDLISTGAAEGVVAVLNKPLDFELLFMYLSALGPPT